MTVSTEFTYRVSVKKADNWKRYDRARFGISVGKPNHEGEKLRAALNWANKRFAHIEVRVSDTLQRYNFPGDPEQNHAPARAAGDAWIARNRTVLDAFPRIFLYRWDDLLADPDLPRHQSLIAREMQRPAFRDAFESDLRAHIGRTGKKPDRCRAFMLEELAVFNMLQERRPATDVYPGTFLTCRNTLRNDFALTRIDFIRAPSLAA